MTSFAEKIAQYSPKRLALLAMELKSRLDAVEGTRSEPIAIIGMGCRFPGGGNDPESYWNLLCNGVDAVTEVPSSRWTREDMARMDPEALEKLGARWGAFINKVDQFDADFFGISPHEAHRMDPQQRILLEVAWEALERAGQDMTQLAGSRTGVFVGLYSDDYALLQMGNPSARDSSSVTGALNCVVPGRLSYLLDLQGPCLAVDTACSSSLVALHLASQSLRNQECSMALACGVNLILSPHSSSRVSRAQALAPDGRCKTFDARANGFVRGEGCGVVVLKRLSDAIAAGDPILALVRGSAVNQDGKSAGLTAPNVLAQQALIRQALQSAGLEPSEIDCVEAHGTGTSLGDPIEMEALHEVYGSGRSAQQSLVVGAAKTNIGHLESAAGIAGIIKMVLSMQHQAVPPVAHFQRLNPRIDFSGESITIPTALHPWPAREERKRRGAVSSFGISGTNAHVILEEPPSGQAAPVPHAPGAHLLPLSARSPSALQELAQKYAEYLVSSPEVSLREVCYTAALRRTHHEYRLAVAGESPAAVAEKLREFAAGGPAPAVKGADGQRKVVFVFPGQGSQWLGMGRQLLEQEPAFREAIERIDEAMRPHVTWRLLDVLRAPSEASRLNEIDVVQPVLFAMAVALSALWRAWGIEPDAVVGHSMGEVAAAHVAGALSLEDAAAVICLRSRLLKRISGQGAMLAAELSLAEARKAVAGREARVAIAVNNSPTSTVLSGDAAALEEIRASLEARNVFCRWVKVDVASHSPQVDSLRADLLSVLSAVRPRPASVPIVSTVTGAPCDGSGYDAAYWVRNLRDPVLFSTAVLELAQGGHTVFMEMSPHPILLPAVERCVQHAGREGVTIPSMRREEAERAVMLESFGALYRVAYPVEWKRLFPESGRMVPLPTYPWQHKRFWIDVAASAVLPAAEHVTSLRGRPVSVAHGVEGQIFELELSSTSLPWLGAHRLGGVAVVPASALVELGLSAAAEALGAGARQISDVEFERALVLTEAERRLVQVHLSPASGGQHVFHIHSRAAGGASSEAGWVRHCKGQLRAVGAPSGTPEAVDAVRSRCTQQVLGPAVYEELERCNVQYEAPLRTLGEVWRRPGEALGLLALGPELVQESVRYQLHPAFLDAGLQTLAIALAAEQGEAALFMPLSIESLECVPGRAGVKWAHVSIAPATRPEDRVGTLELLDGEGRRVAVARGVRLRRVAAERLLEVLGEARSQDWFHDVSWEPRPVGAAQPGPADWLVFLDRGGWGTALVEEIGRQGHPCITVTAGETFQRLDARRFAVNPKRPEDMERLLRELPALPAGHEGRAVYLWGLDAVLDEQTGTPESSVAALHLVKALMGSPGRARLWVVTRGAQVTGVGAERVSLAQAPLWGMGRSVSLEQPGVWGGLIDLAPGGAPGETVEVLREIAAFGGDGEDQLALREKRPLVPRITRARVNAPAEPLRLRPDAAYLVTGGLGGLGLKVAKWLVERGARHLMLLGRSGASGAGDAASARRREGIESLRALGASVTTLAADVADREKMAALLRETAATLPPLRGVIHAAALLTESRLEDLDLAAMTAMMRPKVLGTWVLHELTREFELDFFVMFSSTSTLWGASGLAHYAAGNQFLEALAHHRRAMGLPAATIHWGTWDEIGGERADSERGFARFGLNPMSSERALDAMGQILQAGVSHKTVASVNWTVLKPIWEARRSRPFLRNVGESSPMLGAASSRARLLTELKSLPPARRFDTLVQRIQSEVGRILGFSSTELPSTERGFFQMGMTSQMSVELRNTLQRGLEKELPASVAFDHPTVIALAKRLASSVTAVEIPLPTVAVAQEPRPQAAQADAGGLAERLSQVTELSDEEVERLIAQKLS
ncbi:myxalamid-type polyketide synthase MxaE and MxaD [Stigmatella aurantiaca]|uniref:Myxalamid-type polyketide synthase MxaE and MxaD n=1 Tax=Stigmatella aurantiaca TaxID=41 RepID=A0A1H7MTZ2_STIAU|nr:type I polyketide synthase [Stigmatella aurantiaca]SEL14067.1 myxalamid-type polyketide synthase MxaE and MxaD [Stigmatella aurantiaca]